MPYEELDASVICEVCSLRGFAGQLYLLPVKHFYCLLSCVGFLSNVFSAFASPTQT